MAVVYSGAGLILVFLPGLPWLRLLLLGIIGASVYQALRTHMWRNGARAVEALELAHNGDCAVRYRGQRDWVEVSLTGAFIHPWLVVLSLRRPGHRLPVSLIIPADAVDTDPFRRLRATLNLRSWVG